MKSLIAMFGILLSYTLIYSGMSKYWTNGPFAEYTGT